jgi:dienelactone hydrolase
VIRLRWLAAIVLLAGLAAAMVGGRGVGTAPARAPLDTWVGGYEIRGRPVVLRVTLSRPGEPEGTAALGIAARPVAAPLRRVRVRGGHIALTLPNGTVLEGAWTGSRIAGTARTRLGRGRFELLRLRPSAAGELRKAVGAYRFADGTVVALVTGPARTSLRLVDYRSGALRELSQLSRDAFVGGQGVLSVWPVRLRIQLVRGSSGQVVALRRNGRQAARLPLVTEAAEFSNGDVRLAGKLVRPAGTDPLAGVVLVPGSVRATRDTYELWGMFFASEGLAVLSYDKRGVGRSTGRYSERADEANLRNLAGDALAGVAWLQGRADIDPRRIGLSGGSQAGLVVPLAASQAPAVAFATLQSGPAMSVGRQRAYSALTRDGARTPPPTRAEIHAALDGRPDGGFDPRPAIRSLRIPVLWQLGGVDKRVYTPENVATLSAIAAEAQHSFTVRVYAAGAHSLRETRHGLSSEELRSPGFVDGLFADLGAWLQAHTFSPQPAA